MQVHVSGEFAGPTATAYRRFRRDVPGEVLDGLVTHFGLGRDDRAIDLGSGTGQVAIGLAGRLFGVLAVDPEPDMLRELRQRTDEEAVSNVVCVLAGDRDLPALTRVTGEGPFGLLTVANALHWMNTTGVFTDTRRLLRPGGGVAVISHGRPLWLGERDWAQALRAYLEQWFGPVSGACGTDPQTLDERGRLLEEAGFTDVAVLEHYFEEQFDVGYVLGHLYSALPPGRITADRQGEFEAGLRVALRPYTGDALDAALVEDVPVEVLVGRR